MQHPSGQPLHQGQPASFPSITCCHVLAYPVARLILVSELLYLLRREVCFNGNDRRSTDLTLAEACLYAVGNIASLVLCTALILFGGDKTLEASVKGEEDSFVGIP